MRKGIQSILVFFTDEMLSTFIREFVARRMKNELRLRFPLTDVEDDHRTENSISRRINYRERYTNVTGDEKIRINGALPNQIPACLLDVIDRHLPGYPAQV